MHPYVEKIKKILADLPHCDTIDLGADRITFIFAERTRAVGELSSTLAFLNILATLAEQLTEENDALKARRAQDEIDVPIAVKASFEAGEKCADVRHELDCEHAFKAGFDIGQDEDPERYEDPQHVRVREHYWKKYDETKEGP